MSVILAVLKVVGWILLILVLLLLFLIFLVLFHPFYYRAAGKKEGENVWLSSRISWFFHILGVEIVTSAGDYQVNFRVFGFRKRLMKGREEEYVEPEMPEEDPKQEFEADLEPGVEIPEEDPEQELETELESGVGSQEEDSEQTGQEFETGLEPGLDSPENRPEDEKNVKTIGWFFSQKRKWRNKAASFRKQWNKGKSAKKRLSRFLSDEKNKQAFALLKRELFHLLKRYMPKRMKLSMEFSTGEPDLTGILLGVFAMFPIAYQNKWEIYPDFESEKAYLQGSFDVRGHLTLFPLLVVLIKVYFNRNCRRMYRMMKVYCDQLK